MILFVVSNFIGSSRTGGVWLDTMVQSLRNKPRRKKNWSKSVQRNGSRSRIDGYFGYILHSSQHFVFRSDNAVRF